MPPVPRGCTPGRTSHEQWAGGASPPPGACWAVDPLVLEELLDRALDRKLRDLSLISSPDRLGEIDRRPGERPAALGERRAVTQSQVNDYPFVAAPNDVAEQDAEGCSPSSAQMRQKLDLQPALSQTTLGHSDGSFKRSNSARHGERGEIFSDLWRMLQEDSSCIMRFTRNIPARIEGLRGQEPERNTKFDKFVQSDGFHIFFMAVIMCEIFYAAYQADKSMLARGVAPEVHVVAGVKAVDVFVYAYAIELVFRIASEKKWFFIGSNIKWNWFDLLVVLMTFIGRSQGWVRIMRLMKVIRASRVVKILKDLGMEELNSMIKQFCGCFQSLFWCWLCLCLLTFLFALFFMHSLMDTDAFRSSSALPVFEYFGSMGDSCVTLFMVSTGGMDWKDVYDELLAVDSAGAAALIAYVAFNIIAITNIITVCFMDKMMRITKEESDECAMEQWLKDIRIDNGDVLGDLFFELDHDNDGTLSSGELKDWKQKMPEIRKSLHAKGVTGKEAFAFFASIFETGHVRQLDKDTGRLLQAHQRPGDEYRHADHAVRAHLHAALAEGGHGRADGRHPWPRARERLASRTALHLHRHPGERGPGRRAARAERHAARRARAPE